MSTTTREAPATRGLLQIGDVAARTGLSLRTVRHYEEVGLLPPARRSPGGFRLYDDSAVQRLLVVKQMKPLEFSLEEMRELLDLVDELAGGPAPGRRREVQAALAGCSALVAERIDAVQQRLAGAVALRETLDGLLAHPRPRPTGRRGARVDGQRSARPAGAVLA